MNYNKIKFAPLAEEVVELVPPPTPAKDSIPEWWKRIPAFANGGRPDFNNQGGVDATVKLCMPFADTFRFGYTFSTWNEIKIERSGPRDFNYFFPGGPLPFVIRSASFFEEDYFRGFYPHECAWQAQWIPKLPKGYSVLITHPLNREDLPFRTLTGIIDADDYQHDNEGNHPFFIKEGFDGIIPVGTPIFQMFPFKRENWEHELEEYDPKNKYKPLSLKNVFWGAYKDRFWKKKIFK
jgi:hypothetical protein